MNDASGDCIDEYANAAEPNGTQLPRHPDHDLVEAHLDPSRWWFASSAFPMIAGTLGPVASAFSICALVKPWRQSYPPGTNIDAAPFISDPPWLTAINAVQLAIAILANMALLLNMARRLSFSFAQPVTFVGWYVSSLSLIALTATAAGPLVVQPENEFVWSQAFYYAIYSASLYFLVASLMVVTYMGAHLGRYPKDFMLTPSQRTLMLQTIMFLVCLLLGALLFSNIEGWSYLDAVYWAAVTLFTVGFGDFYATTSLGRALLIPYSLIGIISLGLVIGSIRSLVLDRGRRRMDARMLEKKRRRTLRRMAMNGKDELLVPIRNHEITMSSVRTDVSGLTEFERREREFKLMRRIQMVAARRRRWSAMTISTSIWLILWLAGARVFQECEEKYQGWSYFDGFYFAFVSLTTIGYGDITPVSNAGKSFWVFWALLALPTMTVFISNAGDTIVKGIRDATDQIATVTILPGERGFKKDLKILLRTLSCGVLFEEEIEETPPGILGDAPRMAAVRGDDDEEGDDIEEALHQDEADLEAEGTAGISENEEKKKANNSPDLTDEKDKRHLEIQSTPTLTPRPTTISFLTPSRSSLSQSQSKSQAQPASQLPLTSTPTITRSNSTRSRTPSIARVNLPSALPSSKTAYRVTLIDEIARVTQHLKHHPPRKYTFQEWAWYLRLIGEDEADGERHRRASSHARPRKGRGKVGKGRRMRGEGDGHWGGAGVGVGVGVEGEVDGGQETGQDGGRGGGGESSWSWVGSRSPLMGSQEEAEWILERLIAKLAEELRGGDNNDQASG